MSSETNQINPHYSRPSTSRGSEEEEDQLDREVASLLAHSASAPTLRRDRLESENNPESFLQRSQSALSLSRHSPYAQSAMKFAWVQEKQRDEKIKTIYEAVEENNVNKALTNLRDLNLSETECVKLVQTALQNEKPSTAIIWGIFHNLQLQNQKISNSDLMEICDSIPQALPTSRMLIDLISSLRS